MSKKQVAEVLQKLFTAHPDDTFTLKYIFKQLGLDTHPLKMLAVDTLEEMAWDDYLTKPSDSSYRLNNKTQVQQGRFRRKANGKNSFVPDDGSQPVFVAERNSMYALDGDRVQVTFLARRQKHMKEAVVTAILERAHDSFVGKLRVDKDAAFLVTPEAIFPTDILIPKRKLKGGKTGQKAVVRITQWPDAEHKYPVGEVADVLGEQGDNDVEMNAILAQYGLPYKYPKAVEEAAEKIPAEITPEDMEGREDFRDVFTCTIDPHDAKDFDDALSIRRLDSGLWEVGVHIADVSHYVTEGSIIDKEAFKRATSVYLVDRTIPMLPRAPVQLHLLAPPRRGQARIQRGVPDGRRRHRARMAARAHSHTQRPPLRLRGGAAAARGQRRGRRDRAARPRPGARRLKGEHAAELIKLDALAKKLREARFKNGAVKFDREEMRFDIDEKGHPTRCYFKKSKDANKLIEEFMLLANRTVAESVGRVKKGAKPKTLPYRVHDQPDPTKLETLRTFVVKFGYKLKTAGTRGAISKSLNALMDGCQGRKEQKLIEAVALRAMMKAKYSVHNIGHYGLALRLLHPLHLAHTTLPRHHGAPPAHAIPAGRGAPQTRTTTRSSACIATTWSSRRRAQSATL